MSTALNDDLRMLARAALTVKRELKPKVRKESFGAFVLDVKEPALFRADKWLAFVKRQNCFIYSQEVSRDDRLRNGFHE